MKRVKKKHQKIGKRRAREHVKKTKIIITGKPKTVFKSRLKIYFMAKAKKNPTKQPKKTTSSWQSKTNNIITIDISNRKLEDEKKLQLLNAIRKTVKTKLKTPKPKQRKLLRAPMKATSVETKSGSATINVKITNTEPGLSDILAEHNGVEKELSQSGKMKFDNVKTGDFIIVEGDSLGDVEFTIDRTAKPQQQKFQPLAIIAFQFQIL